MSGYDVNDFQKQVLDRSASVPVLADFWAEWCGPCKALGPVLEMLAGEAGGRWELAKVDTEAHQDIAATYNIRSIPAVKLFVDGEVASEFVGALPEATIRQWLDEVIPGPSANRLREAKELLAAGTVVDTDQGLALLQELLVENPEDSDARVLLAQATLFDDPSGVVTLLEPVSSGARQGERAEALRTLARLLSVDPEALGDGKARDRYVDGINALADKQFEDALNAFIDVVAVDRELDEDGARTACLAIFEILGPDSEITRSFRKRLSRALFA